MLNFIKNLFNHDKIIKKVNDNGKVFFPFSFFESNELSKVAINYSEDSIERNYIYKLVYNNVIKDFYILQYNSKKDSNDFIFCIDKIVNSSALNDKPHFIFINYPELNFPFDYHFALSSYLQSKFDKILDKNNNCKGIFVNSSSRFLVNGFNKNSTKSPNFLISGENVDSLENWLNKTFIEKSSNDLDLLLFSSKKNEFLLKHC